MNNIFLDWVWVESWHIDKFPCWWYLTLDTWLVTSPLSVCLSLCRLKTDEIKIVLFVLFAASWIIKFIWSTIHDYLFVGLCGWILSQETKLQDILKAAGFHQIFYCQLRGYLSVISGLFYTFYMCKECVKKTEDDGQVTSWMIKYFLYHLYFFWHRFIK